MPALDEFRRDKNHYYQTDRHSPLTPEQKRTFQGLAYFPENPDLVLELQIEEFQQKDEIRMQTSTGDVQVYQRFGRLHFTVEGQPAELVLYQSEDGYFLPFVDVLANRETYGAGRYLEPEPSGDGRFTVDFNYAYNPYCAYNELWSCPITPFENRLKVPIRAGEKLFPLDIRLSVSAP